MYFIIAHSAGLYRAITALSCDFKLFFSTKHILFSFCRGKYRIVNPKANKMGNNRIDKVAIFLAELIGTSMLMFLGCMGCISWNGQPVSGFQSSLTFGMVVMLIIQTFGCVSGAHLK